MLGTGDAFFWSDGNGNPTTPPSHIANPNPQPGTDDVYTVDLGFDGNFTECGDASQPGIKRSCSTCTLSLIILIRIANRNIST
jgi:phospholipase C